MPVVPKPPTQAFLKINNNQDYKQLDEISVAFPLLVKPFDQASPFMIKRIWVEGDKFYVEYQNAKSELYQALLDKNKIVKAIFIPSETGWDLVKGQGNLASPDAILYEKDAKGKWIKKN